MDFVEQLYLKQSGLVNMLDTERFELRQEVKQFIADNDCRCDEWDKSGWHVTEKWVKIFRDHARILEPIAEEGDAWAQYCLAIIYSQSLLYAEESKAIAAYEHDAEILTSWLLKSAKQGFLPALDNLLSSGVGPEADRLRGLYNQIPRSKRLNSSDPKLVMRAAQEEMLELYRLAYR